MKPENSTLTSKLAAPVTLALLAVIWLIYIIQLITGVSALSPSSNALLAWGGSVATLSLTTEPWRLFTNIFVHAGLMHILANSYMLFLIGNTIEYKYGKLSTLLLYLTGGVVASLASAVWRSFHIETIRYTPSAFGVQESVAFNHTVSVGASGAIMALSGALLVAFWSRQSASQSRELSATDRAMRNALIQIIAINLVLGFVVKAVDQAAHLGGLVTGAALAWVMARVAHRSRVVAPALALAITTIIVGSVLGVSRRDEKLLEYRRAITEKQEAADAQRLARREASAAAQAYRTSLEKLPAPVPRAAAFGRVFKFGGCPAAMAIADNDERAYIVDPIKNHLLLLNLQTGDIERQVQGASVPALKRKGYHSRGCVGAGASSLAALADRQILLVPSLYRDTLAVFDLKTVTLKQKIVVGQGPHSIAIANDRKRAYVSNASSDTVSVIDLEQLKVTHTLRLNKGSNTSEMRSPMWLSGDDATLFYYNQSNSEFDAYDTGSLTLIRSEPAHGVPYAIQGTPTSNNIKYVLKLDLLYTMAADSLELERRWDLCATAVASSFDVYRGNGVELLATAYANDPEFYEIKIADLASLVTLGAYPTPSEPVQVQFSADGNSVFALGKDGTLSVIDSKKRMRTLSNDISLCVPPEYLPSDAAEEVTRERLYEHEGEVLASAAESALYDPTALQGYLDVSGEVAEKSPLAEKYAPRFAEQTAALLRSSIGRGDYESGAKLVHHYANALLPRAGTDEQTSDVSSLSLIVAVKSGDGALADVVFNKLLGKDFVVEAETNPLLVYNLACYYAVNNRKDDLIRTVNRATALGKKPAEFMADADFKSYWNDADFKKAIAASKSSPR